jgi:uncharacterized protein
MTGEGETIVAFVADLNFGIRIESVAERLGYRVVILESAAELGPPDDRDYGRQYAEPLIGRNAALVDKLTGWRPCLIIIDLSNPGIPWEEWLNLLTSIPATRRIPVLCYGSHVDTETLAAAKKAGARKVVPRSKFVKELPDLIETLARRIDRDELKERCEEELSPEARRGIEEFNRGEYFEAHESLEAAWMADESNARELYRAVLQVAVAYYQILRGNYKGAIKMFLRNRQWIDPLPDNCRGIDVAQLREDSRQVHATLIELGPDRMMELNISILRPVRYHA